jgi:putative ABC transport system permease protein
MLLNVLSYVCVFVSLLGLLGLSAFAAVQRTKEIGIRKVLGANLAGILVLLSKDVVLLVVLASAVAMPLGWYVIDGWLAGFAYRAPFDYALLVMISLAAISCVVGVTMFQSWKTVRANPVDSLKYE